MYGTIARLRTLPGRADQFAEFFARGITTEPYTTPGWIVVYLYVGVDHPDEVFLFAVFDNQKSYRANAESPEQDKFYNEFREVLVRDPEWHDGEITPFLSPQYGHLPQPAYGGVVRLNIAPGADSALESYLSDTSGKWTRSGVATWVLRPDEEPAVLYIATQFPSKRAFVENSLKLDDQQGHNQFSEWLLTEPESFDGRIVACQRF